MSNTNSESQIKTGERNKILYKEDRNYKFLLPFRLALFGEMGAGKSSFIIDLLSQFDEQSDILKKKSEIQVYFSFSTDESVVKVEEAMKKHSFFKKLIKIDGLSRSVLDINSGGRDDIHHILILEDLQANIRSLKKNYISQFTTFLLDSRHKSISIIYVMHELPLANNTSNISFDKMYFEHCTDIILFKSLHNRKLVNVIALRLFPDNYQEFKRILKLIESIYHKLYDSSRCHTVISSDFRKTLNDLERIRFDIFKNKLCIKDC